MLGAPLEGYLGMEQCGGAGGGPESPDLPDRASPEERGAKPESPACSGPPQCKMSRLEVNGSPANPQIQQNGGTAPRPLGGKVSRSPHRDLREYLNIYIYFRCEIFLCLSISNKSMNHKISEHECNNQQLLLKEMLTF